MEKSRSPIRPSWRRSPDLQAQLRLLLRHRRARPVAAAILVVIALMMVRGEHERIRAIEASWGESRLTWVANREVGAGDAIGDADVVSRELPLAALPDDAAIDSPVGQRLTEAVATGEIIRTGRLSDRAASETASQVEVGHGALALTSAAPHLEPGDRVDLYALLTGEVVARNARVIRVVDGQPVVTVEQRSLAAVIVAFTTGDVVPVLVG